MTLCYSNTGLGSDENNLSEFGECIGIWLYLENAFKKENMSQMEATSTI